ncbi:MAG: prenyltransferase/squalene oxidase repeat-containing protein [Phycisphaerales bacterium]
MRTRYRLLPLSLLAALLLVAPLTASAGAPKVDDEHYAKGRAIVEKAIAYLRANQDAETGGWSVNPDGPAFPAITALVVQAMLSEPNADPDDPVIARGVDYLLSKRQPDGGIYDRLLPNYNTSIALGALALTKREGIDEIIRDAQEFVVGLQWDEGDLDPNGAAIDPKHPWYGGAGYGSSGRPDNSNLNLMIQGLYDSGYDCDSPPIQRAVQFLQRTQMHDRVNDMPYADGSSQGGFIYATSPNKDEIGVGESKAGMIDETLDDGTVVSRFRCYGSMTYAGFKSYVYAQLDRDDERVRLAYDWLRRHYTLDENPGLGQQGYYYYLLMFSRALGAWGEPTITTIDPKTGLDSGDVRYWANDLIDQVATLQRPDGSFVNDADRWMEGDPNLVTAYVVLALQEALE